MSTLLTIVNCLAILVIKLNNYTPNKIMYSPESSIGDDLENLSSMLAIAIRYIETEVRDQDLTNVTIGMSHMLSAIATKYHKERKSA